MGLFDGYDLSSSGMSAQRTRINVVSANIANAQTTHTSDGGPYKKQNVVFEEMLLHAQKSSSQNSPNPISNNYTPLSGVAVKNIIDSKDEPMMKYEPGHPDANGDGYVAYPNINPVVEMVDLIEAMRSYEANVSAFTAHKDIDTKTLDILKA
ncbi:MAG: flagellar basal body rod protein FlgC [Campylobacteraceae bacterium]|nr:flagellar basal body rod protein FlgC [Campylobacteraceae bacterium]